MRHRSLAAATFAASLALALPAIVPAMAAEGGAAAGAAAGGAVGGPVGAAVGAATGDAVTGPDRRDVVVDRPGGCSTSTVRKENSAGDSTTVRKESCD